MTQGSGRIAIRLAGAPHRFKYVGYRELHDPERLAFDLFDAAPPTPAAEIRARRPAGACRCAASPSAGAACGRPAASATCSSTRWSSGCAAPAAGSTPSAPRRRRTRRWSSRFRYPPTRRQPGTLEAVALSAKDGTLDCLAQVRVRLGG